MKKLAIARLNKEYKQLLIRPSENIFAVADNSNLFVCHFVFYNLKDAYQGGIYHGKIVFP